MFPIVISPSLSDIYLQFPPFLQQFNSSRRHTVITDVSVTAAKREKDRL